MAEVAQKLNEDLWARIYAAQEAAKAVLAADNIKFSVDTSGVIIVSGGGNVEDSDLDCWFVERAQNRL